MCRKASDGSSSASGVVGENRHAEGPGQRQVGKAEGKSTSEKTADVAVSGRATANVLGYSDARRRLAKQVEVDPYTTNPVLAAKLDEMGEAAFVGELGLTLGTSAVPVLALVNHAAWFSNLVWDTPAGDLRVMVDKKLVAMGVAHDDVDRFLRHPQYSLDLQVALATDLDAMSSASGRAAVVPLALSVASEEQARFVVGSVAILARYHKTVGPIAEVRVAGSVLAKGKDGALIVPAPVDYVAWTERVAKFARRPDLRGSKRGIWLPGQVSERTRRELIALGWAVHEHALDEQDDESSLVRSIGYDAAAQGVHRGPHPRDRHDRHYGRHHLSLAAPRPAGEVAHRNVRGHPARRRADGSDTRPAAEHGVGAHGPGGLRRGALLPKKLIKAGGDPAYVFSLIVTTSLVAIVTVPASLHLLSRYASFDTTAVTPARVASVILTSLLLPLGAGMLIRRVAPGLADRVGDPLLKIAGIVMGLCALVALVAGFHLVFDVGLPSLVAFAAFTLAAIVAGHLLGGPDSSHRASLGVACASRHIGLALLIAANARKEQTLALVVAYLLARRWFSIPYIWWLTKHPAPA